ncbi:MAG TPA: hypothetical protein VMF06_15210 [Candidatus Limnocylindria bacterium]|jgi:hypothetical protein|nr:hypothetical protein [Candidatus Limnocylindria bacterium]
MSENSSCCENSKTIAAYLIGGIGSFLIIGTLAWLVVGNPPPKVDAARAVTRKQFRTEIDAASQAALTEYSIDKDALAKGNYVYHVPIQKALEIAAQDFQDPAAGRLKLIQRLESKSKAQSFE